MHVQTGCISSPPLSCVQIPLEEHIVRKVTQLTKSGFVRPAFDDLPHEITDVHTQSVRVLATAEDIRHRAAAVVSQRNLHPLTHYPRGGEGVTGKLMCSQARPAGHPVEKTGAVMLEVLDCAAANEKLYAAIRAADGDAEAIAAITKAYEEQAQVVVEQWLAGSSPDAPLRCRTKGCICGFELPSLLRANPAISREPTGPVVYELQRRLVRLQEFIDSLKVDAAASPATVVKAMMAHPSIQAVLHPPPGKGNQQYPTGSIEEALQTLTDPAAAKLLEAMQAELPCQNARVVEFNDVASACTRTNSCVVPLGSFEQALGAAFYLMDYMSKNDVPLKKALAILAAAHDHVEKYPSKAEDTGTKQRKAIHILQRAKNASSVGGGLEVSETKIAFFAHGGKTAMCSSGFQRLRSWNFVGPAQARYVEQGRIRRSKRRQERQPDPRADSGRDSASEHPEDDAEASRAGGGADAEAYWSCGSSSSSDDDGDDEGDGMTAAPRRSRFAAEQQAADDVNEEAGSSRAPRCRIFRVKNAQMAVAPDHIYGHRATPRGGQLYFMSPFEYECTVDIVPFKNGDPLTETDALALVNEEGHRGRAPALRWPFREGCQLAGIYTQVLRAKHGIPRLSGHPPPTSAGAAQAHPKTPSQRRRATSFALWAIPVFYEWTEERTESGGFRALPPPIGRGERAWEALQRLRAADEVIIRAGDSLQAERAAGRLEYIDSVGRGLHVAKEDRKLTKQHRFRAATRWRDSPSCKPEGCSGGAAETANDRKTSSADKRVAEEIMKLRAAREAAMATNAEALQHAVVVQEWITKTTNEVKVQMMQALNLSADGAEENGGGAAAAERTAAVKVALRRELMPLAEQHDGVTTVVAADDARLTALRRKDNLPRDASGEKPLPSARRPSHGRAPTEEWWQPPMALPPPQFSEITDAEFKDEVAAWNDGGRQWRPPLNPQQRAVCRRFVPWLRACALAIAKLQADEDFHPRMVPHTRPPRILLHGRPGTGKSYMVAEMRRFMEDIAGGIMLAMAPTGIAANAVDGRTIYDALACPEPDDLLQGAEDIKQKPSKNAVASFQERHGNNRLTMVLFDEASMVNCVLFSRTNKRLNIMLDRPNADVFGDIALLVILDNYQLPPTAGFPMYMQLVRSTTGQCHQPRYGREGIDIFRRLQRMNLTQPMRSVDMVYNQQLETLRDTVDARAAAYKFLKGVKAVDAATFVNEPDWLNATTITLSNPMAASLRGMHCQMISAALGIVVYRWRLPLVGLAAEELTEDEKTLLYDSEPSLWGWAVLGAENLLLHNVCTPRKLSNGASVYVWKLAFETAAQLEQARRAVATAGPLPDGMPTARVATVPTPFHVWVASRTANVSDVATRAGDEGTALGEWWTFPVARRPAGVLRLCQRIPLHGLQAAMLGAKVLYSDAHPLHDAAVRSDFKSQSKTMRMVVSEALEDRALSPHLRISSLVVQASRVTAGMWFKLFRQGTEEEIRRTAFRMCMRHPDELHAWERAYDDWGIYRAELAEEALFELRRLRRERNVPQARRRPSPQPAQQQPVCPAPPPFLVTVPLRANFSAPPHLPQPPCAVAPPLNPHPPRRRRGTYPRE